MFSFLYRAFYSLSSVQILSSRLTPFSPLARSVTIIEHIDSHMLQ